MNWWWALIVVVKAVVVFAAVISVVPVLVWFERRGAGWIQNRRGPNLIDVPGIKGFFAIIGSVLRKSPPDRLDVRRYRSAGLIQPIADAIKFAFKEDIIPNRASRLYYILAPMIMIAASLLVYAVIPFGPTYQITEIEGVLVPPVIHGVPVSFIVAPLDIGILFILAISGLGVYGVVLAGWSSNSKYALIGGLRAGAQLISYEIPMALAIVGVLLMSGSIDLAQVVRGQAGLFYHWNVVPQFIGFVVFVVAMFAETNRAPFDLPEGESEIVAGYHTEYGSMKFMLFYFAEYIAIVTGSMLLVTLYLGGWMFPGITRIMKVVAAIMNAFHFPMILVSFGTSLVPVAIFAVKVTVIMMIFVWVRWTLPRFRYDQLMRLGWKVLLPLALLNIMVTAMALVR